MKKIYMILAVLSALGMGGYNISNSYADDQTVIVVQQESVEHGGGCRKSSPPGKCCHKDHSTGIVHCH